MVRSSTHYKGKMQCELVHEPSGSKIETDAPRDNGGLGQRFSPTDLLGAALSSCVITTMAIVAERDKIDFTSAKATVEKVMTDAPRRVASLSLHVTLPASLTPEQRVKFERVAHTCPVHRSLHPEVQMPMTFDYV
jgi:putative redox protein